MKAWKIVRTRVILDGLVIASLTASTLSAAAQSTTELPSSPGVAQAQAAPSESQQPGSQTQQPAVPQNQPQLAPQKPVGTAAAESPNANGVAASQPAGVAIAPAKQRRTRTVVLRIGAIIGAGVAIGTVAGLTLATSSKPPGTH